MRSGAIVPACLTAFFVLGCGFGSSTPFTLSEDRFEDDGDIDNASEVPVNRLAERRTIWPSEDVDFIRIRVNEPGVMNDTDELPRYWFRPTVLSGSLAVDLLDWRGRLCTSNREYDTQYNFFKIPGIYYVRYEDAGNRGGAYRHDVWFWREAPEGAVAYPDLIVSSLEHAGSTMVFESDTNETFTIRIANQGSEDVATPIDYEVWLNATGSPGDGSRIRSGSFSSLSMEVTFAHETFTAEIPLGALQGPGYLVARVIPSVNEGPYWYNNTLAVPVVVDADEFAGWNVEDPITLNAAGVAEIGPRRLLKDWTDTLGEGEEAEEVVVRDIDELELVFDPSCPRWIEVWTSKLHGGIRTTLELVDDAGTVLADKTSGHAEDGSAYMRFDQTALPASPSYHVRVSDTSGRAGAYTLNFRVSEFTGGHEPDDGPWTWRTLEADRSTLLGGFEPEPLGSHVRVTSCDEDWMAYPVRVADGTASGRIHTITVAPGGDDISLDLYRHSNLATSTRSGLNEIAGTLTPGLYYLKASGGTVGQSYTITATVVEGD